MSDKKDDQLSDEDLSLWQAVTDSIKRSLPLKKEKTAGIKKTTRPVKSKADMPVAQAQAKPFAQKPQQGRTMDRRTEQRLKQGKIQIDDVLDLHGLNQAAAQALLIRRVTAAHKAGRRLVLVITGKGLRSSEDGGVLKKALPRWCDMPPLCDIILKRTSASPQHGGSGAVYLYLRRQRP